MNKMLNSLWGLVVIGLVLAAVPRGWSAEQAASTDEPTLVRAVMCETIHKFAPIGEAVVFSLNLERIACFTEFDPVPQETIIYHRWYRRGILISAKQFTINPPRWSSFSSMQLRDADKGPWQVDVADKDGRILKTLRFSITD